MGDNIKVIENATCTFCGCVCDDQTLTVDLDEKRITKVQNTCALGRAWFTEHAHEERPMALIDGTEADVVGAWHTVRAELDAYGHGLSDKAEIVGLNKCDALDAATVASHCEALAAATGARVMALSGVSGEGVSAVLESLEAEIRAGREQVEAVAAAGAWQP